MASSKTIWIFSRNIFIKLLRGNLLIRGRKLLRKLNYFYFRSAFIVWTKNHVLFGRDISVHMTVNIYCWWQINRRTEWKLITRWMWLRQRFFSFFCSFSHSKSQDHFSFFEYCHNFMIIFVSSEIFCSWRFLSLYWLILSRYK